MQVKARLIISCNYLHHLGRKVICIHVVLTASTFLPQRISQPRETKGSTCKPNPYGSQSQSQEGPLWQRRPGLSSRMSSSAYYAAQCRGAVSSEMHVHAEKHHIDIICLQETHVNDEWQLIPATLCRWRRCFLADQLWFMTRIQEDYLPTVSTGGLHHTEIVCPKKWFNLLPCIDQNVLQWTVNCSVTFLT